MFNEPKVCIILLNYNGIKDTIECIESLNNIDYNNYEIIIVDNNSSDNSQEIIQKKFPEHTFIQTGKNLGYAAGNNMGIRVALDREADYICVINNDVIVEKDFLTKMILYMEANTNIGVCGPTICEYMDRNKIQSSGALIDLSKGEAPAINNGKDISELYNDVIECDYVGGACLLFKSSIIDEVGFIPENYFLFYEETEFCLKIKKIGYKVCCYTKERVYHKGSASISRIGGLSGYFMNRNLVLFEKRNLESTMSFIKFLIYIYCREIYMILKGKSSFKVLIYYYHGLTGKIDKRYGFAYINDNY
ncbi:rhamnosyltransferase [Clostridium folliculivorans]|uniref:Rhamnosyltransferase n=1 Tax=Clostridium folliculivorans TaxID=2886038 RepID=A0A9W6DCF8_9CLOT|nr:glycosyltransferase family 2 protein [Clostridium folliculivorans]GKU27269.1 rhamnosyltransferase [Clostridium folliculivorans]